MSAEEEQPQQEEEAAKVSGNGNGTLAKLLAKLDIPTLVLVSIMGGGNLLKTSEDGRLTREEAVRVSREVHELYNQVNEFEQRQKVSLDNQAQLIKGQSDILRKLEQNQRELLSNQQKPGG